MEENPGIFVAACSASDCFSFELLLGALGFLAIREWRLQVALSAAASNLLLGACTIQGSTPTVQTPKHGFARLDPGPSMQK